MKIQSRGFLYLLIIGISITLFLVYRYGFKDRYLNLMHQTAVVDLARNDNKAILIEKHPEQSKIEQLELTVKGNLSDNITLNISENGINSTTSIRVKKGKIETSFAVKWSQDKAYLLIENPNSSKSHIEIEYQFISRLN